MVRVANPYSEGEESDTEDRDYTVVGDGGESLAGSEAETLVPGAVQHVHQTGYPSTWRVKQNKVVKKSVDVNEKPPRKKGRKLSKNNLKPTKAQLLAEPVTHHLYFKAAQDFYRGKTVGPQSYDLHKLRVDVVTPHGRKLEYEETLGKLVVLDYNKSILSANFNSFKFDFNPWDLYLHLGKKDQKKDPEKGYIGGPSISF